MRAFSLVALLCAFAIPVAGCGNDDDSSGNGGGGGGGDNAGAGYGGGGGGGGEKDDSGGGAAGGGGETLRIAADPAGGLKFDKSSLTAPAGKVTIVMDNPSDLPHAVEIEGNGVEVAGETVMKGDVSRASAELEAGEYEFYCPVGNHQDAGMTGTLTVN
jgi:plastocyanin